MRIAVAMCTFNGARHLNAQLDSLARQTRLPDELFVLDDHSTDNTIEMVEAFARQSPFVVRWAVNEERLGFAGNFSEAISRSHGDLIFPCDQDDVWAVNKLERMHQVLADRPDVGLVFSDVDVVDQELKPTGLTGWQRLESVCFSPTLQNAVAQGDALGTLVRFNVISGNAMAFRAELRQWLLPIPQGWAHDEWIGLMVAGISRIAKVDPPLTLHRQHTHNSIGSPTLSPFKQIRQAKSMGREYFQREVLKVRGALERLKDVRTPKPHPGFIDLLNDKREFVEARYSLGETGIRLPQAWRLWRSGGYDRFAYGWRSFLQDVFLR